MTASASEATGASGPLRVVLFEDGRGELPILPKNRLDNQAQTKIGFL